MPMVIIMTAMMICPWWWQFSDDDNDGNDHMSMVMAVLWRWHACGDDRFVMMMIVMMTCPWWWQFQWWWLWWLHAHGDDSLGMMTCPWWWQFCDDDNCDGDVPVGGDCDNDMPIVMTVLWCWWLWWWCAHVDDGMLFLLLYHFNGDRILMLMIMTVHVIRCCFCWWLWHYDYDDDRMLLLLLLLMMIIRCCCCCFWCYENGALVTLVYWTWDARIILYHCMYLRRHLTMTYGWEIFGLGSCTCSGSFSGGRHHSRPSQRGVPLWHGHAVVKWPGGEVLHHHRQPGRGDQPQGGWEGRGGGCGGGGGGVASLGPRAQFHSQGFSFWPKWVEGMGGGGGGRWRGVVGKLGIQAQFHGQGFSFWHPEIIKVGSHLSCDHTTSVCFLCLNI